MPSTFNPLACWNALIAATVFGPETPSAFPGENPAEAKLSCNCLIGAWVALVASANAEAEATGVAAVLPACRIVTSPVAEST